MCISVALMVYSFYSRVYKVLVSLDDHEARHSLDGQCRLVSLVARGDIEAIKNYRRSKCC